MLPKSKSPRRGVSSDRAASYAMRPDVGALGSASSPPPRGCQPGAAAGLGTPLRPGHYDLSDLERAMEALARSRREDEEPTD